MDLLFLQDNVIMCDPLGEEDITVEEDPLGYNEELEVKDEPFEFFDDPVSPSYLYLLVLEL